MYDISSCDYQQTMDMVSDAILDTENGMRRVSFLEMAREIRIYALNDYDAGNEARNNLMHMARFLTAWAWIPEDRWKGIFKRSEPVPFEAPIPDSSVTKLMGYFMPRFQDETLVEISCVIIFRYVYHRLMPPDYEEITFNLDSGDVKIEWREIT